MTARQERQELEECLAGLQGISLDALRRFGASPFTRPAGAPVPAHPEIAPCWECSQPTTEFDKGTAWCRSCQWIHYD
jgi:hypothetical protein